MTRTDSSRVYLAVPFPEKDAAKRHGARWDAGRRQWWIDRQDIDRRPGIRRWIVDDDAVAARAKESVGGGLHPNSKRFAPVRTLATTFGLPACTCSTPPWEHCEHTLTQS